MGRLNSKKFIAATILLQLFLAGRSCLYAAEAVFQVKIVFNVRDFHATGKKSDDARPAIQKAIDSAAAAGGGTVYLPPGDYTSGTLLLRSHINVYIEAGATLFASEDPAAFDLQKVKSKDALFFGEDLEDIAIGGRGTVDGQARYFWAPDTIERTFSHKVLVETLGKSQMRSYPLGHPDRQVYPHLLWLGRCKNVSITGVSFVRSFSWTFALYACSRVEIDSIYMYTSLKEAVWADGIDIVSCNDVNIANSTIATGDDCIVFVCGIDEWGPTAPCEHVTVTNCRLSSASAAIKFSEGNNLAIRDILINNCAIFDTNRGVTLQIATGGSISNVVMSNLTMDLHRFDWFWAGDGNAFNFELKRKSEWNGEPVKLDESPGSIHNIIIHDVIVHCQGASTFYGHPDSWLDGVTFENVKFFISSNPASPYDTTVNAMSFRYVKNLRLRNIEVNWEKPWFDKWESALSLHDVDRLQVDGFAGSSAFPQRNIPAVVLDRVKDASLRNMEALPGTDLFLKIAGANTQDIHLYGNNFREAKTPYRLDPDVKPDSVTALDNFMPVKSN
jgi:uncharacterized Zn-finger protein